MKHATQTSAKPARLVYLFALLSLLGGGCMTDAYNPYSPDYVPEMPDSTTQAAPRFPQKVAAVPQATIWPAANF